MTVVEDLELQLKGLVLVRAILDYRGASAADLQKHSRDGDCSVSAHSLRQSEVGKAAARTAPPPR